MTETPSTSQQINALFLHLNNDTLPDSGLLFVDALKNIDLDYSDTSIVWLDKTLELLSKKYNLNQILEMKGGENFLLVVAGYLGHYIAKKSCQPIVWYDYDESEAWRKSYQELQSDVNVVDKALPKTFVYSLTAMIGSNFLCLPLLAIQKKFLQKKSIADFVVQMQKVLFDDSPIHPHQDANRVCHEMLSMIAHGKLLNTQLEYYSELQFIDFDFSKHSLQQIDDTLANIKAKHDLNKDTYRQWIQKAQFQRFVFFISFYVGMTSAKLAKTSVRWINHAEAQSLISQQFPFCMEHAFLQAYGEDYQTPILVVNNSLFNLTNEHPKSVLNYANEIVKTNQGNLQYFSFNDSCQRYQQDNQLPAPWQMVMEKAGFLVSSSLLEIYIGGSVEPRLYEYDEYNDIGHIISDMSDDAVDIIYQQLANNPRKRRFLIASYQSHADLPTGRMNGIVLEVRIFNDLKVTKDTDEGISLNVQFVLPYRANSPDLPFSEGMAIYPLVNSGFKSNEELMALTNAFYKGAISYKSPFFHDFVEFDEKEKLLQHKKNSKVLWRDFSLSTFDKFKKTLWQQRLQESLVDINLPVYAMNIQTDEQDNKHQQTIKTANHKSRQTQNSQQFGKISGYNQIKINVQ